MTTKEMNMDELLTSLQMDADKVELMVLNLMDYFGAREPSDRDMLRLKMEFFNVQTMLEIAEHFTSSVREKIAEAQDEEAREIVG